MTKQHLVALAVTAGAPIFELAIPCEIFGRRRDGLAGLQYDLRICAPPGPAVHTGAGFVPDTPDGYDVLERADTVIVTALRDASDQPPADLVAAVRAAHRGGARLVSLCTGAFVLAAAGILDGRPATTHWYYADEMARRYPAVQLDPSVLYIDDGDVLTSAGTSAGIDLCLHIVSRDHGAAAANALARRLVAPAHRSGGQAQYIEAPAARRPAASLAPLLDWMRAHLHEPLSIPDLATQAALAERTLIRQFRGATGSTPLRWLNAQRVLRARQLLETSTLPVDQVAAASGLGSPANFRRHFTATVGVPPSAYRSSFRAPAALAARRLEPAAAGPHAKQEAAGGKQQAGSSRGGAVTGTPQVRLRRVYDEESPADGLRVLVDRLWPRGLSKEAARVDEWLKAVAPSDELRRWYGHLPEKFPVFRWRYADELLEPERAAALAHLQELAGRGTVTLLTAARDIQHSQAAVLAERLRQAASGETGQSAERGGDPVCWLPRVCRQCGSLADADPPTTCPACHAAIPGE